MKKNKRALRAVGLHPENEMLYDRLKQTSKVPVFEQGFGIRSGEIPSRKELDKAINSSVTDNIKREGHIDSISDYLKYTLQNNEASFIPSKDGLIKNSRGFAHRVKPDSINFIGIGKNYFRHSGVLAHEIGHSEVVPKEKVTRRGQQNSFKRVLDEAVANSRGKQILRGLGASDDYLKQYDKQRAVDMETFTLPAKREFLKRLSKYK